MSAIEERNLALNERTKTAEFTCLRLCHAETLTSIAFLRFEKRMHDITTISNRPVGITATSTLGYSYTKYI